MTTGRGADIAPETVVEPSEHVVQPLLHALIRAPARAPVAPRDAHESLDRECHTPCSDWNHERNAAKPATQPARSPHFVDRFDTTDPPRSRIDLPHSPTALVARSDPSMASRFTDPLDRPRGAGKGPRGTRCCTSARLDLRERPRAHPPRSLTTMRALLAAGCVLMVLGCAPAQGRSTASVVRVIDGDTVVVNFSGRNETIRLLGIDTPETVAPDRPVECYGPEASEALKALLPASTEVDVVIDAEPRDRYRRLLAYVYRRDDGMFINAELLSGGAARTLSYDPNTTFKSRFAQLESSARTRMVGLWGACATSDEHS